MKERFNLTNMSLSLKLTIVKVVGAFFILLLVAALIIRFFFTQPHVSFAEFNQMQHEYFELEHQYNTLKEEYESMKSHCDAITDRPGGHIDVELQHPGNAGE